MNVPNAQKLGKLIVQALALFALLASHSFAVPLSLDDYLALSGPSPTAIFHYGPAPSQKVAFYRPHGAGPFPVVVLVHGGCWQTRFGGLPQMGVIGSWLAKHGIAAWNVEYRRLDEAGGGYPGMYFDMRDAMDLLGSRAADLDLDVSRVVAIGHSAGGQLALWASTRAQLPKSSPLRKPDPLPVSTVISLGGLDDLKRDTDAIGQACGVDVGALTGLPSNVRPDVFSDTSPAELVSDKERVVAINGSLDSIAPPTLAQDLVSRVRAVRGKAKAIIVPRSGHLDEVSLNSPVWPILEKEIDDALGFSQSQAPRERN